MFSDNESEQGLSMETFSLDFTTESELWKSQKL